MIKVVLQVGNREIEVGNIKLVNGTMINENVYYGAFSGEVETVKWNIAKYEMLDGGDYHAIYNVYDYINDDFKEYYTQFNTSGMIDGDILVIGETKRAKDLFELNSL